MTQVSYADLFGIFHEPTADQICEGDTVVTGPNDHPRYRVIAVRDDRAWVQGPGGDAVVPTSRCRKINE